MRGTIREGRISGENSCGLGRVVTAWVLIAALASACVTTGRVQEMSTPELEEAWSESRSPAARLTVVEELERRKAVEALEDCLTLTGSGTMAKYSVFTVDEVFGYLSRKVPEASGQDQHPVRKGETQGELVIGRVR